MIRNAIMLDAQIATDMPSVGWDTAKAKVVCVTAMKIISGYRTSIHVMPRRKGITDEMYRECVSEMLMALEEPRMPYAAFAAGFYTKLLNSQFGLHKAVLEVKEGLKGKGTSRKDLFKMLEDNGISPLHEPLDEDPKQLIDAWQRYEDRENEILLQMIIDQSIANLQKNHYINQHIDYLKTLFILDKDGFVQGMVKDGER
jgi:hypothetical protein